MTADSGEVGQFIAPDDIAALVRAVATRLRDRGAPHPMVGAAVLAARGIRGVDAATYAAQLSIDITVLANAEAGNLSSDALPSRLKAAAEAALAHQIQSPRSR